MFVILLMKYGISLSDSFKISANVLFIIKILGTEAACSKAASLFTFPPFSSNENWID